MIFLYIQKVVEGNISILSGGCLTKKNLDLSNHIHKTKVNQRLNIVICLTIT